MRRHLLWSGLLNSTLQRVTPPATHLVLLPATCLAAIQSTGLGGMGWHDLQAVKATTTMGAQRWVMSKLDSAKASSCESHPFLLQELSPSLCQCTPSCHSNLSTMRGSLLLTQCMQRAGFGCTLQR
jgi:hypothetical protein